MGSGQVLLGSVVARGETGAARPSAGLLIRTCGVRSRRERGGRPKDRGRLIVQHPPFPNPPVVEAVAGLRFARGDAWTPQQRDDIPVRLRPVYSGESQQEHELQVTARIGPEPAAQARSVPSRSLAWNADRTALLGVGPGLVSVHVLKALPGLGRLRRRIQDIVGAVLHATAASALLEVAIRYVDRIALPLGAESDLARYFRAIPQRPDGMPSELTAFEAITETRDPATGTIAALTTTSVPPNPGEGFVMLCDLNLVRLYPANAPLAVAACPTVLEALHELQLRIFLDSITDQTRELFQ